MMAYPDDMADVAARFTSEDDILTDGMLSTKELAALIGVDTSTLRRWRTSEPPAGPPFVPISGRVTKYRKSDVRRWIDLLWVATSAPTRKVAGL
jgi:predicted DNA-binding transcriptional regulator AlpA